MKDRAIGESRGFGFGNLNFRATEADVRNLFAAFGTVLTKILLVGGFIVSSQRTPSIAAAIQGSNGRLHRFPHFYAS